MATSGPNSPATAADDDAVGTVAWDTPSNALLDDANQADAVLASSAISHYIKLSGFGRMAPPLATIDGLEPRVKKSCAEANVVNDSKVRIIKGGVIGSDDQAAGGFWPTSEAYTTYGGASEKWGETWNPASVNGGLGLAVSAFNTDFAERTGRVNHADMKVHYTLAARQWFGG